MLHIWVSGWFPQFFFFENNDSKNDDKRGEMKKYHVEQTPQIKEREDRYTTYARSFRYVC